MNLNQIAMKDEIDNLVHGIRRASDFSEGLTSLLAGTYVLSLAFTKGNTALKIALGIAGGYLILRSGQKMHSSSDQGKIIKVNKED